MRVPGQRLHSYRTVTCLTNVEAFALRAADLEEVTRLFPRFFRNPRVQGAIRFVRNLTRTLLHMSDVTFYHLWEISSLSMKGNERWVETRLVTAISGNWFTSLRVFHKNQANQSGNHATNSHLNRYVSPYWRGLAARRIQVAWRYRKRCQSRANISQPQRPPWW